MVLVSVFYVFNISVSLSLYMWEKQVYYNSYYIRDYLCKTRLLEQYESFICVYVYREHLLVHKYKACVLSSTFFRWSKSRAVLKSVMKMRQNLTGVKKSEMMFRNNKRKKIEVGGNYF